MRSVLRKVTFSRRMFHDEPGGRLTCHIFLSGSCALAVAVDGSGGGGTARLVRMGAGGRGVVSTGMPTH